MQAQYDAYVKADPTDASKLGDCEATLQLAWLCAGAGPAAACAADSCREWRAAPPRVRAASASHAARRPLLPQDPACAGGEEGARTRLVAWACRCCSWAQVRAAAALQADYERHLVDLKHKPDWWALAAAALRLSIWPTAEERPMDPRFLQLTEAGTTPVLKANEDDKVLTDSGEILGFLDDKISSPHLGDPSDMPERCAASLAARPLTTSRTPAAAGPASQVRRSMKELLPTFVKYLTSKGPDSFKHMTALRGVLEEINGYFKANGPLIHGRDFSAADCVLAPLLYQIEIACLELKVRWATAGAAGAAAGGARCETCCPAGGGSVRDDEGHRQVRAPRPALSAARQRAPLQSSAGWAQVQRQREVQAVMAGHAVQCRGRQGRLAAQAARGVSAWQRQHPVADDLSAVVSHQAGLTAALLRPATAQALPRIW